MWLEICVLVLIYSLLYSPLLSSTLPYLSNPPHHHHPPYHHHTVPSSSSTTTTNHQPQTPFTLHSSPITHSYHLPLTTRPPSISTRDNTSLSPSPLLDRVNEPNNPSMAAATLQLEEGGGNSGGGGGGYFWYAAVLAHGCIPLSARRTFLILLILLIPSIRQCCSRTPSPGITCMVSCIVYHVSCSPLPNHQNPIQSPLVNSISAYPSPQPVHRVICLLRKGNIT